MPEYTDKEYLQQAIKWVALALRADTRRDAWRRYNTAASLAIKAGVDIYASRKDSHWPPYKIARNFLVFALRYIEPKGE